MLCFLILTPSFAQFFPSGDGEEFSELWILGQSDPFPDSEVGIPSTLEPVFEYRVFLKNKETWEKKIDIFFENISFGQNISVVSDLLIDNNLVSIDKTAVWDSLDSGFYYQLFFELWIYNSTISDFEFHNRSVGVWLNMSRTM